MGAWNASITANDTAQDLRSEYQAAFYYNDVETAVKKLDDYVRTSFGTPDDDAWCDYVYSLADYMWKHGILTESVRNRALEMIDTGFGLDIWAESGEKILQKRQKVLQNFREKLLSPQPQKKKITVKLYTNPIFEIGDLVAIQLQTKGKYYLASSRFSEEAFRNYDGSYVVFRKVADHVSYTSAVEPAVKDIWPVFQLYKAIFDHCPTPEELQSIPWADPSRELRSRFPYQSWDLPLDGTFISEGSMFYYRKRNYKIVGTDLTDLPAPHNYAAHFFLGHNYPHTNADTGILNAIL